MPTNWPVEEIPDNDSLYMRVHKTYLTGEGLNPGVFNDKEGGMSTDWNRYSTPQQAQGRAKTPAHNGIISLNVGGVREAQMTVSHEPISQNRAHTEVIGEKDSEARLKLLRLARWEIGVPQQPI